MKNAWHPSLEEIYQIHRAVLRQDGGSAGVRSLELLESALAAPRASFGGESIMKDHIEVAAAYLYYLCRNHPFIDGNKRVAMVTCITYLRLNGHKTPADSDRWECLVLDVASSELDRAQTTARLLILLREEDLDI